MGKEGTIRQGWRWAMAAMDALSTPAGSLLHLLALLQMHDAHLGGGQLQAAVDIRRGTQQVWPQISRRERLGRGLERKDAVEHLVCVCVCARARVRACVRACVRMCRCARVRAFVRV